MLQNSTLACFCPPCFVTSVNNLTLYVQTFYLLVGPISNVVSLLNSDFGIAYFIMRRLIFAEEIP